MSRASSKPHLFRLGVGKSSFGFYITLRSRRVLIFVYEVVQERKGYVGAADTVLYQTYICGAFQHHNASPSRVSLETFRRFFLS